MRAVSSAHISSIGRGDDRMQSSSRNPTLASSGITRRILSTMISSRWLKRLPFPLHRHELARIELRIGRLDVGEDLRRQSRRRRPGARARGTDRPSPRAAPCGRTGRSRRRRMWPRAQRCGEDAPCAEPASVPRDGRIPELPDPLAVVRPRGCPIARSRVSSKVSTRACTSASCNSTARRHSRPIRACV